MVLNIEHNSVTEAVMICSSEFPVRKLLFSLWDYYSSVQTTDSFITWNNISENHRAIINKAIISV